MKRIAKISLFTVIAMLAVSCNINDMKLFTDYYIAFDPGKSSTTYVNEAAEFAGQYQIHFCTAKRDETVSVTVEAIPGDGLQEGVDYRLVTAPLVKFAPGVYDKTFIVEWLPHTLDPTKDNSLTLKLTDCSDANVVLGVPGPSSKDVSIRIVKQSAR